MSLITRLSFLQISVVRFFCNLNRFSKILNTNLKRVSSGKDSNLNTVMFDMFGLGQQGTFEGFQYWLEVVFSSEMSFFSKNRAVSET